MTLYRLLLRLLPRDLRQAWGDEMERLLARRLEDAASPGRRLAVWAGACADAVVQAAQTRVRAMRDGEAGPASRRRAPAGSADGAVRRAHTGRRGGVGMETLVQDVRWALRSLAKAPGFTAVALLTLGLGIGGATAVFTVVNAVLLRPLPYGAPERLVSVWPEVNFNAAMVDRVVEGVPALEGVTGVTGWDLSLEGEDGTERLRGAAVSWNHFQILGVRPVVGRAFVEEERDPARSDVAILSHDLWQTRFGGDPGVVGRTLRIGGMDKTRRTVVGVMGPRFQPVEGARADVWIPLDVPRRDVVADSSWYVNTRVGRLAPGASLGEATEQLRRVAADLHREVPYQVEEEDVVAASLEPLKEARVGSFDRTLGILMGAVGLLLLIACVNVANLLLARGEARERELAVRQALGAGRGRVTRQLLTESVVLGLAGGALGVICAAWGVGLLMGLVPSDFPRAAEVGMDPTVLGVALAASLVSALVFGVLPALRASRAGSTEALRSGSRSPVARRTRRGTSAVLVAAEVALAVVLVTGSGLMLRTLVQLEAVDPGFDPEGVLVARVNPPATRYASEEYGPFYERALEAVRAVPGVQTASAIHLLPATVGNWGFPVFPEGVETVAGEPPPTANFRIVQPGWFETMRIPLLRGRTFTDEDRPDGPRVVVVNRAFADRHWPGEAAVGKEVGVMGTGPDTRFGVVGVVGDVHQFSRDRAPRPEMYVQFGQTPWGRGVALWFAVRAERDPLALADAVRQAVWSVDPAVPITDVDRMERVLDRSSGAARFVALLLSLFGGGALLLGAVGVYGVTAFTMARRVPEFGVRMALGAPRASVLREALTRGMLPVAAGLAVGVLAATMGAGVMEGLLFGVPPRDPVTLVGVAGILALAGLAAAALPAARATAVDPARVLREE